MSVVSSDTQFFDVEKDSQDRVKLVLADMSNNQSILDDLLFVRDVLKEKGYNPVNQIVGYIMSGDPTYITSHNNARSMIMKAERDELVEEMLIAYIEANGWN